MDPQTEKLDNLETLLVRRPDRDAAYAGGRATLAGLNAMGVAHYDKERDRWVLNGLVSGDTMQRLMMNAASDVEFGRRTKPY